MQAAVAKILGHGNRRIHTGFPRGDRHVGGIGDNDRAFHQRSARARVFQLGEFVQHFRHLVTALAAAHIDDDVRIAPLGQGLLQNRLAGAKATRQRGAPTPGHREQSVQNALAGDDRPAWGQARGHRPRPAYRPMLG